MNQQSLTKSAAEQLPAHLVGTNPSDGFLPDDRSLVSPPRIKILQATSVEVGQGLAAAGDIWSQARQVVLVQPVEIIPICQGSEWMEFDSDAGKVLWRTTNPKDPRATYEYYGLNVLALVEGEPEILSFRSTALKVARSFHQEAKRLKAPLYAQRWTLKTAPQVSDKRRWYGIELKFAGFVDAELFEKMKKAYETFKDTFSREETTEKGGEPAQNQQLPF